MLNESSQKAATTSRHTVLRKSTILLGLLLAASTTATPLIPDLNLNIDINKLHKISSEIFRDGRDIARSFAHPTEGCNPTPSQGDNCHGLCMVVQKGCPPPVGYGIRCGSDGWFRNKYCAYDLNGWCRGVKASHACESDNGPVDSKVPRTFRPIPRHTPRHTPKPVPQHPPKQAPKLPPQPAPEPEPTPEPEPEPTPEPEPEPDQEPEQESTPELESEPTPESEPEREPVPEQEPVSVPTVKET